MDPTSETYFPDRILCWNVNRCQRIENQTLNFKRAKKMKFRSINIPVKNGKPFSRGNFSMEFDSQMTSVSTLIFAERTLRKSYLVTIWMGQNKF